jgi:acyl-CoA thioesterase
MRREAWRDLDVVPSADVAGRYGTEISDDWMLVVVPHGGAVAAMAAEAMRVELDDETQSLRTLSIVFAGQVAAGPVEIDVTVLRRGRSMSQLSATVRNPGADAGLTALAVFGAARQGFSFTERVRPDLPGPDGLRSLRDPLPEGVDPALLRPPMPFWDRIVDARFALGRAPWEPFDGGPAELAYWYRLDDPPLRPDGTLDPAALIVLCDTMPGAVAQKIGPDGGRWFGPSADLTVHVLEPARPGWVLAHNQARHAGDGYASVEMALWDPSDQKLLAYATQVMFFAFGI